MWATGKVNWFRNLIKGEDEHPTLKFHPRTSALNMILNLNGMKYVIDEIITIEYVPETGDWIKEFNYFDENNNIKKLSAPRERIEINKDLDSVYSGDSIEFVYKSDIDMDSKDVIINLLKERINSLKVQNINLKEQLDEKDLLIDAQIGKQKQRTMATRSNTSMLGYGRDEERRDLFDDEERNMD